MNAAEKRRLAERQELVEQSIALHGGPYAGCEDCAVMEEQNLRALHSIPSDWRNTLECWHRHLATG